MNCAPLIPALASLVRSGIGGPAAPGSVFERLDWDGLLRLGGRHEVLPLLHAGCLASNLVPPDSVRTVLRQAARASEIRVARGWDQIAPLLAAFNAEGVEPALLKGSILGLRHYRSPGLRPFSDIDLLVLLEERAAAVRALEKLSYRLYIDTKGHGAEWAEEHHHHWGYVPPAELPGALKVELHWALTPPRSTAHLETAALLDRSKSIAVPGGRGRALALEDEVIHLSVHAAKHQFMIPFRQTADLAALLLTARAPDWETLWRRAEEAGAFRDVAAFLGISQELGLVELPEEAQAGLARGAQCGLDYSLLAHYVVEWPWVERPHGLLETLAAPSLGAAVRRVRSSFGRREKPAHEGNPLAPRGVAQGAGFLERARHFAEAAGGVRAQVMIRRQFGDREAP